MNLNEYPEQLIKEEQEALNNLLKRLGKTKEDLKKDLTDFDRTSRNADTSTDLIGLKKASQNSKQWTEVKLQKLQEAQDELYDARVLLEIESKYDGKTIDECRIGLHGHPEYGIVSYTLPVFRNVIFKTAPKFSIESKDKYGDVIDTYHYRLLVKNNIKLRFTTVKSVLNQFPNAVDKELLDILKDKKFFSDAFVDELIRKYDPNSTSDLDNAKLITDQFLQELLERRSSPEFQNIVFSIQEKQSEIVQLPFKKNIIVQGCAGSGKSMIMLHRLPILLVDNPKTLARNSIYIISPSPAYIQMADNLRRQLEIEDISMGTMKQYYDHCIERYNRKTAGYGTVDRKLELSRKDEEYIYSDKCTEDIREYITKRIAECGVDLEDASELLDFEYKPQSKPTTIEQFVTNKSIEITKLLEKNRETLRKNFVVIREIVGQARNYSNALAFRKTELDRAIKKLQTVENEKIAVANKELLNLREGENDKAIANRKKIISDAQDTLDIYTLELEEIEGDKEYFDSLQELHERIDGYIDDIGDFDKEFENNKEDVISNLLNKTPEIIGGYYGIEWINSNIAEKYADYLEPLSKEFAGFTDAVSALENSKAAYLDNDAYMEIADAQKRYNKLSRSIIDDAYKYVFESLGKKDVLAKKKAYICSPYLYLNIMYRYYGLCNGEKEALVTIDEAQSMNPNELMLIKAVNGGNVIFNLYGDIKQHFENKVGIDDWGVFNNAADFEIYELQENYRNASEITAFCNERFGMKMNAINTAGNGVHKLNTEDEFRLQFSKKLVEEKRSGLSAIIVKDRYEVRYLNNLFPRNREKFHDMTGDEYDLHRTRWNVVAIDDAKGLEFNSVLVLSGRMTENEKYVAYTRALDELYVYDAPVPVEEDHELHIEEEQVTETKKPASATIKKLKIKPVESTAKPIAAGVRSYFESYGLEVIDKRAEGGRLWVLGNQYEIAEYVNEAIKKFGIMGQYTSSKESRFKPGWCTKTKK